MIVGIDEVGRGAWAGPMAVGAVAIGPGAVEGLADSKTLSKKRRQTLALLIKQNAAYVGIGWVSAKRVDELGITDALKLAARRAMAGFAGTTDEIIIDGTIRLLDRPNVSTLAKADQLIPAVSAAAIVAKVARDNYMTKLHAQFPEYGFASHVGYGTASHRQCVMRRGATAVHRMSFMPMASLADGSSSPKAAVRQTAGARAEAAASEYLEQLGYRLVERNWKTRQCEIDIIAEQAGTVYFVEVKYRSTSVAGTGFEYVTAAKQRQMAFAAESWRHSVGWKGKVRLAALQVGGESFAIENFTTEMSAA